MLHPETASPSSPLSSAPGTHLQLASPLFSRIPHSSSAFCIGVKFRIPHSSRLSPLFHSKTPGLRDGLYARCRDGSWNVAPSVNGAIVFDRLPFSRVQSILDRMPR